VARDVACHLDNIHLGYFVIQLVAVAGVSMSISTPMLNLVIDVESCRALVVWNNHWYRNTRHFLHRMHMRMRMRVTVLPRCVGVAAATIPVPSCSSTTTRRHCCCYGGNNDEVVCRATNGRSGPPPSPRRQ